MNMCTQAKHDKLKADPVAWKGLFYVGIQEVDETYSLELRNCPCGSTIAIRVEPKRDDT